MQTIRYLSRTERDDGTQYLLACVDGQGYQILRDGAAVPGHQWSPAEWARAVNAFLRLSGVDAPALTAAA